MKVGGDEQGGSGQARRCGRQAGVRDEGQAAERARCEGGGRQHGGGRLKLPYVSSPCLMCFWVDPRCYGAGDALLVHYTRLDQLVTTLK